MDEQEASDGSGNRLLIKTKRYARLPLRKQGVSFVLSLVVSFYNYFFHFLHLDYEKMLRKFYEKCYDVLYIGPDDSDCSAAVENGIYPTDTGSGHGDLMTEKQET